MGYSWSGDRGNAKTRQRLAATYRPDARLDNLILAIERDPTLNDKLTANLRLQLGSYKRAKAAAETEVE